MSDYQYQQHALPPKPGKVQAIAILSLVDGILNVMWAPALGIILILSLIGICFAPLAIYPMVVGIFGIIHASRLLSSNPVGVKPDKTVAVLQIVNIVTGNVLSLVTGILSLVFYDDPEVEAYYNAIADYRR
jgi:uncharacterized membrane protein